MFEVLLGPQPAEHKRLGGHQPHKRLGLGSDGQDFHNAFIFMALFPSFMEADSFKVEFHIIQMMFQCYNA